MTPSDHNPYVTPDAPTPAKREPLSFLIGRIFRTGGLLLVTGILIAAFGLVTGGILFMLIGFVGFGLGLLIVCIVGPVFLLIGTVMPRSRRQIR
jgi:hypothetical protein